MPNGDHYDPWAERIKAIGSLEGFLRYLIYAVIILLQLRNGGKVDGIATEAKEVKTALVVSEAKQSDKLHEIATDVSEIKPAALTTNAINTKWLADRTGEPDDMAKAMEATAKAEQVSKPNP